MRITEYENHRNSRRGHSQRNELKAEKKKESTNETNHARMIKVHALRRRDYNHSSQVNRKIKQ